ncbi:hypothetical protein T05_10029 [Trichinella murrelli]|uniref:Protein MIS12 homolog n=1 Tax=Trichinella murrelli TaxID=144512 RepID=A0A0V0TDT4_9BILA|nr:hypothetical protein T05_10029 [Trichinella murrelli]
MSLTVNKLQLAMSCHFAEYEYEVELFSYSPNAFVDSVYNFVHQQLERSITEVVNEGLPEIFLLSLTEYCEKSKGKQPQIDRIVTKAVIRVELRMKRLFQVLEKEVFNKVFRIPSYVALPQHAVQNGCYRDVTQAEYKMLQKQTRQYERRICALLHYIMELDCEIRLIEELCEISTKLDAIEMDTKKNATSLPNAL